LRLPAVRPARICRWKTTKAITIGRLASTRPGERAAFLLGTAVALRGTAVTGDPLVTATAARATEEIGEAGFAAAYAQGVRQTREEVLAELG